MRKNMTAKKIFCCAAAVTLAALTAGLSACDIFGLFGGWRENEFLSERELEDKSIKGLPAPEYTDGHCNGNEFYATVDSFAYFTEYTQTVYDYIRAQGLYVGRLGEMLSGIGLFSTYEFLPDFAPRNIFEENAYSYTFLYTANAELDFGEDDAQSAAGTANAAGAQGSDGAMQSTASGEQSEPTESEEPEEPSAPERGTVQNVCVLRMSYSAEPRRYGGEKEGEETFEYNFEFRFMATFVFVGGTSFDADVQDWAEYVGGSRSLE